MVTQLLFGDSLKVLEEQGSWLKIQVEFDGYECWVDKKQVAQISEDEYNALLHKAPHYTSELLSLVSQNSTSLLYPIVLGTRLPHFADGQLKIGREGYNFDGVCQVSPNEPNRDKIVTMAMDYLNTPYLWGGKTPFGIDCSGLTQMVYRQNGLKLLRDANQQAEQGELLSFVEESQPGDLAFFDNDEGRIVHTGIVLSNQKIIHASGQVRIDSFDHQGIFNHHRKDYSHRLRLLKRYF